MLAAVIFDFDGVIVDTEPLHYKAFQNVLMPMDLGYSWQEYIDYYIGFDDRDAFRAVFSKAGRTIRAAELHELIAAKAESFQKIITAGVEPYPGVVELIRDISGTLPLAICSGALLEDIVPILGQFGLSEAFNVTVTADDVEASKPDPACYQLAVRRLVDRFPEYGITPAYSLAIEDTPAGIISASGAGIKVLAVTNSYPEEKLSSAWKVVPSLQGINLATLDSLL